MKMWQLIIKDPPNQPADGVYQDWKEQIANECYHRCVYCAIHERPWGGIDHYHIDHFRPVSKFAHLENDIRNLFYACPVCNRFKSDNWPNEPDLDTVSYADPSQVNYAEIFEIDYNTFKLSGLRASAKYMILRLYLNRPQLVYERRESYLMKKEMELTQRIGETVLQTGDFELASKALKAIASIRAHLQRRETVRPYRLLEIRKS